MNRSPTPLLVTSLAVFWLVVFSLAVFLLAGCVNVDPKTGEVIPRGNQRYEFSSVQKRAERLQKGMSKREVLLLLGSAAEMSRDGDTWVYLPERPAVLIPGRALHLVFERGRLAEFGYRAIVLGQEL